MRFIWVVHLAVHHQHFEPFVIQVLWKIMQRCEHTRESSLANWIYVKLILNHVNSKTLIKVAAYIAVNVRIVANLLKQ